MRLFLSISSIKVNTGQSQSLKRELELIEVCPLVDTSVHPSIGRSHFCYFLTVTAALIGNFLFYLQIYLPVHPSVHPNICPI